MARAVYQHDLNDPDFVWLFSRFQENHPEYCYLETVSMPLIFIPAAKTVEVEEGMGHPAYIPPEEQGPDAEGAPPPFMKGPAK